MTSERILINQRFSMHMEVHSKISNIGTCTICKDPFKDGHMGTRHGEDSPRHYCDICFRVLIKPCCGSENPLMKLTKLMVSDQHEHEWEFSHNYYHGAYYYCKCGEEKIIWAVDERT